MLPKWKDEYSVYNDELDADHKKLFSLAQEVYYMNHKEATKERIRVLLTDFFNYMKNHFDREENYMREINYPKLQEHQEKHQKIVDEMTQILKTSKSLLQVQTIMKNIVKKWLVEHIIKEDLSYEIWYQDSLDTSQKRKYCRLFKKRDTPK